MVPGGYDFTPGSAQLATLDAELATARRILGSADAAVAPVGVGFILTHESVAPHFAAAVAAIVARRRPAAIWLFAPRPDDGDGNGPGQAGLTKAVREAGAAARPPYEVRVLVQVGTVAAARRAAREGADVIVAQGVDAGGHQFAAGSGVVGLVPEVRDMLDAEFAGCDIGLVAAGGIADGRGVAAALALGMMNEAPESTPPYVLLAEEFPCHCSGAHGAVLGTRFLVSNEAATPDWQRKVYLETKDGGVTTNK